MSARSFSRINLLPKDQFEFSVLGKFLHWTLTSGRVLVVLTEFIVILSFASRFYYDKRLNDQSEVIVQEQAVVDSYADAETKIRDILFRQKAVLDYMKSNLNLGDTVDSIRKTTPSDVNYTEIVINSQGINLAGSAGSEAGFNQLISGVNAIKQATNVTIGAVEFDQKLGRINFKIKIDLGRGDQS